MSIDTNKWLEEYEIKRPDYDYIERSYIGMKDVQYDSERFYKENNCWLQKKPSRKIFSRKKAKIMFVGDITCFERQIIEAQQEKGFNFDHSFEKVKPIFNQADLVVGNLETMVFSEAPYRTEKYVSEQQYHCNGPIEYLDAIRKAGVDVLTNANNHDMDTGAIGIGATIDNIERFGFIHTGTFKSEKKRYEIIDVNGIKVAIIAFATEHNNKACNLTEQGIDFLLNNYSYEKAEHIIKEARNDGAEVVFVCIHWGKENKTVHNDEQTQIAKELIELGYDCIIGSHPHVLQPFTMMEHDGKTVPVFYSMGNFISHNANNAKARTIIACIDMKKKSGKVSLECSYVPVFTSNNYGEKKHVVLPINEQPTDIRNAKKLETIKSVIGNEINFDKTVSVSETMENDDPELQKKKTAKLDLTEIESFPVEFDNGKFVFSIYEDHAVLNGLSQEAKNLSYSTSEKILGLPLTEIKEGAFENNQLVKKVNFKKNLERMSARMFKNCKALEGVQMGMNIKEIEEEAFYGCLSLSCVVIKKRTEKIGTKAFANCEKLRSVKIPNGVKEIAEDAFEGCPMAVFYCEEGSYAEKYANEHGFKVVNMKLY